MKIFMKYRKMLAVVAAIASCTMAHADEVAAAATLAGCAPAAGPAAPAADTRAVPGRESVRPCIPRTVP